ncbi:hypothetical protein, partial [Paenibacillus sp. NEAU-GSW1]|uniref:hypothetical protein n=1 Tax=Paenibacillus sp. NEAU-GSW1 TaxID=2682486 RepID=UPI001C129EDE
GQTKIFNLPRLRLGYALQPNKHHILYPSSRWIILLHKLLDVTRFTNNNAAAQRYSITQAQL